MVEPRIRLVVLFGGVSAEHEVSCVSAAHVLRAVDPDRYDLVPVGVSREGRWSLSESTAKALAEGPAALPAALEAEGPELDPLDTVARMEAAEQVVVLPLLHGPMGEDGTVQGLLELADVPYVGAGVLSSALCMDKVMAKVVLGAAGLPQPHHLALRQDEVGDDVADLVGDELGYPVFVKPANLGSSVGITKVVEPAELARALATALSYDEWVLVEEAVAGREIEVGVLGNERPRASVPGEIVPTHEFYDYEDKYLDGAARMVIPAELPGATLEQARDMALQAYRALRGDGLARVDFFFEDPGRGLLVNEVNTIPGFTPFSMYPSLWAAAGVSYGELIDELVRLALDRHQRRRGHGRPR